MTPAPLKVGLVQLASGQNVETNLKLMLTSLNQAQELGAQMVCFPENSLYFRQDKKAQFAGIDLNGPELHALKGALKPGVVAHLGAFPLAPEASEERPSNATVILRGVESGAESEVVYKKIHLFDVEVQGAPSIRESDHFARGKALAHQLNVQGWRVASTICYDLRFSELFRAIQPFEVGMVPSAFLQKTGEAHWHVLLRARAIETQSYVVASAQATKRTYGHSLVVDPWGKVICDMHRQGSDTGQSVEVVTLDHDVLRATREQVPMEQHRKERLWSTEA